jgi:hypothetical protein
MGSGADISLAIALERLPTTVRAEAVHLDQNSGLSMTKVRLRALPGEHKLRMKLKGGQPVPSGEVGKDRLELRIRNLDSRSATRSKTTAQGPR